MTLDSQELLETLSGFSQTLTRRSQISDVLYELAEHMTALLGVAGVAVSLSGDGGLRCVAANQAAASTLQRAQEETSAREAGPSVEAHLTRRTVAVANLRDETARWPAFAEQALASGVVSVAAIPMNYGGERVGAVGLFGAQSREWTVDHVKAAQALTDIASSYVIPASELQTQHRTNEQLQRALETRIVIEQAKGMIANASNVSVDQALQVLRKHARDHNVTLHEIANAVVHLDLRP
jgi:transcriptional regulator with GAF, ATPase, and Fis domain